MLSQKQMNDRAASMQRYLNLAFGLPGEVVVEIKAEDIALEIVYIAFVSDFGNRQEYVFTGDFRAVFYETRRLMRDLRNQVRFEKALSKELSKALGR